MSPSDMANTETTACAGHSCTWQCGCVYPLPTRAAVRRQRGKSEVPGQPGCSAPWADDLFWQFCFWRRICPLPSEAWSPGTRQLLGQAPVFYCMQDPGDVCPQRPAWRRARHKAHTQVSPPFLLRQGSSLLCFWRQRMEKREKKHIHRSPA